MLSGILNLNKPPGVTSRDVVNRVSRPLRKLKVGHAGTLDPLASGVLVVCVGPATRLIEYVQRRPKVYRTVIRLGARSDTLDADGRIHETPDPTVPDESRVREALAAQVGAIEQVPPEYSALKVQGRRAYDLARAGRDVELAPRTVVIDRIDLLSYVWPRLEIEVACGGGTYIRSIARDVGEALGCGGLVEVLIRTRIGGFRIEEAIDPDHLTSESIPRFLRPPVEAVPDLPRFPLSSEQLGLILQGRPLLAARLSSSPIPPGEIALLGPDGTLAAIAEYDEPGGRIQPRRVLVAVGGRQCSQ